MILSYVDRDELHFARAGEPLYGARMAYAALSRHPRAEWEGRWVHEMVRSKLGPGVLLRVGERSMS